MELGSKIKALRTANGLTLEELAARSELSKGFLSQVERDLTSPSIATLEDILEALGTTLAEFFQEQSEEQVVFSKEDYFKAERDGYTVEWIVPNAQKNEMEPILMTIAPHGHSQQIANHQGQELGYILKGSLVLELENGRRMKLRSGETFYLDGTLAHHLENPTATEAKVLWVSTPPIF